MELPSEYKNKYVMIHTNAALNPFYLGKSVKISSFSDSYELVLEHAMNQSQIDDVITKEIIRLIAGRHLNAQDIETIEQDAKRRHPLGKILRENGKEIRIPLENIVARGIIGDEYMQ